MPIVEALAREIPVMASDIPAHREASQGCAQLIDPHDAEAWQQAISEAARLPKEFYRAD